jgi:hypothetical protein
MQLTNLDRLMKEYHAQARFTDGHAMSRKEYGIRGFREQRQMD